MKDTVYIVVTRTGFDRALKRNDFTLKPDERAFALELEIPDEAFAQPPMRKIKMTLTREELTAGMDVTETTEPAAAPWARK